MISVSEVVGCVGEWRKVVEWMEGLLDGRNRIGQSTTHLNSVSYAARNVRKCQLKVTLLPRH